MEDLFTNPKSLAIIGTFTLVGAILDYVIYAVLGFTLFKFLKKKFFKKGE